jgi:hypothetical protein
MTRCDGSCRNLKTRLVTSRAGGGHGILSSAINIPFDLSSSKGDNTHANRRSDRHDSDAASYGMYDIPASRHMDQVAQAAAHMPAAFACASHAAMRAPAMPGCGMPQYAYGGMPRMIGPNMPGMYVAPRPRLLAAPMPLQHAGLQHTDPHMAMQRMQVPMQLQQAQIAPRQNGMEPGLHMSHSSSARPPPVPHPHAVDTTEPSRTKHGKRKSATQDSHATHPNVTDTQDVHEHVASSRDSEKSSECSRADTEATNEQFGAIRKKCKRSRGGRGGASKKLKSKKEGGEANAEDNAQDKAAPQ